MVSKSSLLLLLLLGHLVTAVTVAGDTGFNFTNPPASTLNTSKQATILSSGLIQLTSYRNRKEVGYAFYNKPFKVSDRDLSFSTTFVLAIVPKYPSEAGEGLAFALSPTVDPETRGAQGGKYLGMFGKNGSSEDVFVVEFDTFKNDGEDVKDIDSNHVGVDINDIKSLDSTAASYFDSDGVSKPIRLRDGKRIQAWIDYDGMKKEISVTIAPFNQSKPKSPLLETTLGFQLWSKLSSDVYVGFSATTSRGKTSHYILGWSFRLNGEAPELDLSELPKLPSDEASQLLVFMFWTVGTFVAFGTVCAWVIAVVVRGRKNKDEEALEDWEMDYGPQRFPYFDLYEATGGFKQDNIVGGGGFGMVYKGVLTKTAGAKEVAVKRIHHESKQGLKEFVTEIVSTSRLRHRNLIQLLGYCRRRDELLLVYDFMPNGSLDRHLFGKENSTTTSTNNYNIPVLNWNQRFEIIKGIAAGLLYLHEEWVQVVVHRDIKSGNVLLDGDLSSKLSDFGLARLYDHGSNSQTTSIVGTYGYLAPELTKTGKATTMTDVFAFGSLLLEVVSGRRASDNPLDEGDGEYLVMMDWALECWTRGMLVEVVDKKLKGEYVEEEVNKVVQLAVMCSHPNPSARLSIRQVMRILEGDESLPPISPTKLSADCLAVKELDGFDGFHSPFTAQQSLLEMTSDMDLEKIPIRKSDVQNHPSGRYYASK